MHLIIIFGICLLLALLVLVLMDRYARHLGSPGPSDLLAMTVVAAILAVCATGAIAILWEIGRLGWELFQ